MLFRLTLLALLLLGGVWVGPRPGATRDPGSRSPVFGRTVTVAAGEPREELAEPRLRLARRVRGAVGVQEVRASARSAPDRIAGRVLDHEGRPVAHARLSLAAPVDPEDAQPRARRRAFAWTDELGRFEITGLGGPLYEVDLRTDLGGSRRLVPRPIRPGTNDVELRPDLPRLDVRVRGSRGRRQPVMANLEALFGFGKEPALAVHAAQLGEDGEPIARREWLPPTEVRHGLAVFDLEPGLYRIVCGDEAKTQRVLQIPAGAIVHELDLLLSEPVSIGGLSVTVRDPEGALYRDDNRIVVLDGLGEVVTRSRHHSGATYRTGVPPGDYTVRITAQEDAPSCGTGWVPKLAPLGPVEVPVTLRVGEETAVDVRLARGGRLRVLPELPEPPSSALLAAVLDADHAKPLGARSWAALEPGLEGPAVRVVAAPDGGEPSFPLQFTVPGYSLWTSSPCALPGLGTLTNTLLPPGRYTLRVEDERWSAPPVEVVVAHAEVTDVTLRLRER